MAERPTHYVRRFPVGGAFYNGESYETGQVIKLAGARNDEKLIALGYIAEFPKGDEPVTCGRCGKEFRTDTDRRRHGDRKHRGADLAELGLIDPTVVDLQVEEEEVRLNKDLPYFIPDANPETINTGAGALPDV